MTVRQTSRDAFKSVHIEPLENEVILAFEALGESCIADVAQSLNRERFTIAARINKLYNESILFYAGKRKSHRTGILSEHYRLRRPQDDPAAGKKPEKSACRENLSRAAQTLAKQSVAVRNKSDQSVVIQQTLF